MVTPTRTPTREACTAIAAGRCPSTALLQHGRPRPQLRHDECHRRCHRSPQLDDAPLRRYTQPGRIDELGIENAFPPIPQHHQQVVEKTGEPDYALFHGFSFSTDGPPPNANVAEEAPAPVLAGTVEARS